MRFGLFYCADSPQTRDMAALARRGWLAMPGPGDAYQSWVHVDDAASGVVAALRVPSGAYNVVEDHPLTNRDHGRVLAELVGRRVRLPPSPLAVGPLRLQKRSQRVSNHRLRDASTWRPTFPSREAGWADVFRRLGDVPTHVHVQ